MITPDFSIALLFLSSLYVGWCLGSNDFANVFGTGIASKAISRPTAALCCALFAILGADVHGLPGIETYSRLTPQSVSTATITLLAAAISVTLLNSQKLPISVSQSVVGAMLGVGLALKNVETAILKKVVLCWIFTPLSAVILTLGFYQAFRLFFALRPMGILQRDRLIWIGLLGAGCYASYAFGANAVANVVGPLAATSGGPIVSPEQLLLFGGASIGLGAILSDRRIVNSVGSGVIRLDGFTALVSVLGMAGTIHLFAILGVPVSLSQGIIGAIVGVGLARGGEGIKVRMLRRILAGWFVTPLISLILASSAVAVFVM